MTQAQKILQKLDLSDKLFHEGLKASREARELIQEGASASSTNQDDAELALVLAKRRRSITRKQNHRGKN